MRPGFSGEAVRTAEQPLLEQGRGPALMAVAAHGLQLHCRRLLRTRRGRVAGSRAVVLAGKGNNGGDGLWAAAALRRAGVAVTAIPTADSLHEDGARALRQAGGVVSAWPLDDEHVEQALDLLLGADLVIDAVLGTGASGGLRGAMAELARSFDQRSQETGEQGPVVVAVDVPSGLSADGGALEGPVLPAASTVTFGAAKTAQLTAPGDRLCGRVEVVPIGIEAHLRSPEVLRLEDRDLEALWPRPVGSDHKYTRGVVGIVAGSEEYPGAALLTVRSALAAGTGMVRYLGDESTRRMVNLTSPEAVVSDGAPADEHVQAWISGPGAVDEAQQQRCEQALAEALQRRIPAVLDAGALEIAGRSLADTRLRPWIVLTPHAGELAELLRWCEAWDRLPEGVAAAEREQIEADPVHWARTAARATGATVVLKGATTTVAAPSTAEGAPDPDDDRDGASCVLTAGDGSPWLATAGSGDCLAGMLGTLLAHDSAQPQRLERALGPWLADSPLPEHLRGGLRDRLAGDGRWSLLAALAVVLQGRASRRGGEGPQPCRPEDIRAALTRGDAGSGADLGS
ncbi:NAD(P)H-hydrate epimerase [Kocuria palustris]|jgi:hydroxyethylthiazole kinase-like uncharacterized protein yjeF|uniref:NAD(P)H-hydrate epimerase n=1 Tax=Kocuria palustris TaxID=71999 RepID=UPI0006AA2FF3|nr:NAD(P)H-hydrate epimerase [Kocuria palustris]ALB03678.1 hypothetical protein KPaMU14_09730 [Kocuria palustris]MBN6752804.1 NAD(P)H-hydrate epimerase [Kocuria palustris]MBN6757759.1 NAD(P)H-hydrate epimerase [Kocuria palustris]MBN6762787.1 NAD(P)H-hydrate epimerase [Kocuria palustris]MBN6782269.1 NAD(P)H-hydrate epimerase [Kocuria palustris]